jgi:tripartite-type tricarboxylate transporter receptor subunit TctC
MTEAVGRRDEPSSRSPRCRTLGAAILGAVLVFAGGGIGADAQAQSAGTSGGAYPTKPLRFILPVAAGSTSDTIARLVARALSDGLGQQVVAENQPGAGGNIGVPIAARAPGDGYTLLLVSSAQAISPSIYTKLSYDLARDFRPVTQIADGLYMLTIHPSVPAKSVQDLIALARKRPGQLSFGSAGVGTGTHLTGELLKAAASIDLLHVPYRGMGPAIGELAGGQISMAFLGLPSGLPQMQSGKVRALGVTSSKRSSVVPELPTLAESGLPGFESTTWQGIVVPAATPPAIVAQLNSAIIRALDVASVRSRFAALGVEPAGNSPDQFARYIDLETNKWGKLVRAIGLPKQ